MRFNVVAVAVFIFSLVSSNFSQQLKEREIGQPNRGIKEEGNPEVINADSENPGGEALAAVEAAGQPPLKDLGILYKGFAIAPFEPAPLKRTPFLFSLDEAGTEQPKVKSQDVEIRPRGFNWDAAIRQSMFFLGIQHSLRLTQKKTVDNLRGPFFGDYLASLRGVKGWGDGDGLVTNYIGHPAMGAISGFIQIQNDAKAARLPLSRSKEYWKSRAKALAWSAAYSTQFEIGLLSEATIGNVGKKAGSSGYVDFVVTPTLGTFTIVLEDAADKYLVAPIERRTENGHIIRLARILLNPTRSFANLLRLKKPWHRERGNNYSFGRNQRP